MDFVQEFFLNVKNVTRKNNDDKLTMDFSKWLPSEIELDKKFSLCKSNVHAALCGKFSLVYLLMKIRRFNLSNNFSTDNIDTKTTLEVIRECISACNIYLRDCGSSTINHNLLSSIAKYITGIIKIFGIKTADEIGFPVCEGNSTNDVSIIFICLQN